MHKVKLSVRHLVEFMLQTGDIDRSIGAVSDAEAMLEGSRIHRKLQKKAGPEYKSEVPLKIEVPIDEDILLILEGRADGIITEEKMPDITEILQSENMAVENLVHTIYTIDEIKSTYTELRHIKEPVPVHLAQACCYAYIYAKEQGLSEIDVMLTYVQIGSEQMIQFRETKSFKDLEVWFLKLVADYGVWIRWYVDWQAKRTTSIEALKFPFTYRKGQKRLMGGVYQTMIQGKKLFALAPTGTGKTISTLFPALKVMGDQKTDKIFYLTARTITRTVAQETLTLLESHGLDLKSITLTARDKICIFDEAKCNPEYCERAKGHYDRVNDSVFDMITHENQMTEDVVRMYAKQHCVCPFEMQLDASLWVDTIICDYNYVCDPNVYLRRFFGDTYYGGKKENYIYLIDEAHNLVERGREMYSALIKLSQFYKVRHAIKGLDRKLTTKVTKCIKYMEGLKEDCHGLTPMESIGGLSMYLMRMMTDMEKFLKSKAANSIKEQVLELYLDTKRFINAYENMDQRYMIYGDDLEETDFLIKIFCLDPSKDLCEHLDKGLSTIYFSATLLPIDYYKQMLSATPTLDYDLYTPSPFDSKNRWIGTTTDITSKYTRRNLSEYQKIAKYIRTVIRAKNGNYMVFFPSYAYMEAVYEVFSEQELSVAGSGIKTIMQENAMTESAREAFLEQFQENTKTTMIGFCVLGGIFSEGIDLKADRLIGVMIVGTGLPQIGNERELLRSYFEKRMGMGYEYAYVYPGMNKVLQAGGRVIRTEEDCGIILLMDERFLQSSYKHLFPPEWLPLERVNLHTIEEKINQFWD